MTAGAGAPGLAIAATVITLIVLLVLPSIEGWFEKHYPKLDRP
jgi:uncharacterized membrane protein YhiD involved in acid resistance